MGTRMELWEREAERFVTPVPPWTTLTFHGWDSSGETVAQFSQGEREAKYRSEEMVDANGEPETIELAGIGRVRLIKGQPLADPKEGVAGLESIVSACSTFALELGSPDDSQLGELGTLLAEFVGPEVAGGIREFGFRERLVRARSDNHSLPSSLREARVTCLDMRLPAVRERYGDHTKPLEVSQRWVRMYVAPNWLVSVWSPPVPSWGLGALGGDADSPSTRWRRSLDIAHAEKQWLFPPRSQRWRRHNLAPELREPTSSSGSDLAIRLLQDSAVAIRHVITETRDEIACCERQLFTEAAVDASGIMCEIEDVQVDLMILGGFIFDLNEDLAMLAARTSGERIFDPENCAPINGMAQEMVGQVEGLGGRLRETFSLLSAVSGTRRASLEETSQKRQRQVEIAIGVFAAVAIIPNLALLTADVYQQDSDGRTAFWVGSSVAVFGTFLVVALLVVALKRGIPGRRAHGDADGGSTPEERSRLTSAEWDPEWPPGRADRP